MKKVLVLIMCLFLITITYFFKENIVNFFVSFIEQEPQIVFKKSVTNETINSNTSDVKNIKNGNEYTKKDNFLYLKQSENLIPYSYGDILNILYTTINSGWDSLTFYCPKEYYSCIDDVGKLEQNSMLNYINDFVHPFNTAVSLTTTSYSSGEVTVTPTYLYSKEDIEKINNTVDTIIQNNITDELTDRQKIRVIHDYIINNVSYDTEYTIEKAKTNSNTYHSNTAYGPLFERKAICNGYADLMAIFLSKMGYTNYKVATPAGENNSLTVGHVWNAVKLDNNWYHLDLTWDDPISDNGKDYLFDHYFLVTTEEMQKEDAKGTQIEEHNFDKRVYLEFNELIYS